MDEIIASNLIRLINEISYTVRLLEVPEVIRKFSRTCYRLLKNPRLSGHYKMEMITALIKEDSIKQAMLTFQGYGLIYGTLISEEHTRCCLGNEANFKAFSMTFFACYNQNFSIIELLAQLAKHFHLLTYLLVSRPVLLNYKNKSGQNLADLAEAAGNSKAVNFLREKGIVSEQYNDKTNELNSFSSHTAVFISTPSKVPAPSRQENQTCRIM